MKFKINYLTVFFFLFAVSCSKNEELRYPQGKSALNIWLGANTEKPDSLVYNYAFKSLNEVDTIWFSVRLAGLPASEDRKFSLEPTGGDTSLIRKDVHYIMPEYVLKAGSYQGVYPILMKRSADFKNRDARIIWSIKENNVFSRGAKEQSGLLVIVKDQFSKPANWDVDPQPYFRLSAFFGTYSNVKFQFITTVIGRAPTFKVRYSGVLVPPEEVSYTQAQYWQSKCKTELIRYNAAHPDEPLKNENKEIITFP